MPYQFQHYEHRRRYQRHPEQFVRMPLQFVLRRTEKHRDVVRTALAHSPNLFLGIRYESIDILSQFRRRCFQRCLELFGRFFGLLGVLHQQLQLPIHIHFQLFLGRQRRQCILNLLQQIYL